ncbi:MAG: ubiquinol-cytochrome c reductase [Gammaproteobacteria bacterium]|nr:MAG: ubiquinol-cytochrome c reductase [Gammaproteobacteria bacterium]RLA50793.1 MAG: ubiquinol-cytochrome c reductase [Gammaproteobacteria bacterium]
MKWLVALWGWVDDRLPVERAWNTHMAKYYAPKNFNFWYFFGVLSMLVMANQFLTGIWLTMSFEPSSEDAFASVEYIMRDVDLGWILRYMHSTGASAFFLVIYLHMFRGLLYGSYKAPRELVWLFGMAIFLALMAEGFLGYVLPWGQMSYWGAQVIISLFGAIPYIGEAIVEWVRGDYLISGITLNRFFALHVVAVPIVLLGLVVLHLLALHEVGSNNPDGIEIKKNKDENGIPLDGIPFHPYYTVHDLVPIVVFLFVFCFIVFFMPEMGGYFIEYANFEIANPLKTPEHIAPVWYFTPFYSMLRAVTFELGPLTAKFLGFLVMAAAVAILFVLPWLDRSPVKSIRYKGNMSKVAVVVFAASFVILGVLGVKAPTPERTGLAQICTVLYFLFFLAMPIWTSFEKTRQEPDRVTMDGGMGFWRAMGVLFIIIGLVVVPLKAVGSEASHDCGTISCDAFEADGDDKASLQRGAQIFVNYCMGCHSAKYSRWERVADDLGVPHGMFMDSLMFTDQKIGQLMQISMPVPLAKQWFGVPPPDLTLVTRARSPQWVYTYLRNFYADDSRPYGVNNKVFKDVGMPHALLDLQGLPVCAPGPELASNGGVKVDPLTSEPILADPCGTYELVDGKLSADEYDVAVYDLVNFLSYLANPVAGESRKIGVYVLLFLLFLLVWVWLLNREYWKDVH